MHSRAWKSNIVTDSSVSRSEKSREVGKEFDGRKRKKKETRYLGVARENALSYTIPQPCNVAFTFQSFSINSRATVFDTRTSHFRETEQPSKLDVSFSSLSLSSYFSSCFERQAPRYRYQCLKRARKRERERERKSLCSDQRNTEGVECERSRYVEY